jgi:hypothetical protein
MVSRPKTPVQDPGRALQEHRARVRKQLAGKCFFRIFAKTTVSGPKTPVQDPGRALQEHRARVRKKLASKCFLGIFAKTTFWEQIACEMKKFSCQKFYEINCI